MASSNDVSDTVFYNNCVTENGTQFTMAMPKHINSDTKIILYDHGMGGVNGRDSAAYLNYMQNNNINAVFLSYNRYDKGTVPSESGVDIVNYVSKNTGISTNNFVSFSHSGGSQAALKEEAQLIKQNPGKAPQVMVMLDGSMLYAESNGVNDEVLRTLGNNGTTVIAVDRRGRTEAEKEYRKWESYGINVVRVTDTGATANFKQGHAEVNRNGAAFLNYIAGNGQLPSSYISNELDFSNGPFQANNSNQTEIATESIEIKPETKKDLENLIAQYGGGSYSYDELFKNYAGLSSIKPIKTDNAFLDSKINGIRGLIKETTFLSNIGRAVYDSTTNIPNVESLIVQNFLSSSAELLHSLEKDTEVVVAIGDALALIDAKYGDNGSAIDTNIGTATTYTSSNMVNSGVNTIQQNNTTSSNSINVNNGSNYSGVGSGVNSIANTSQNNNVYYNRQPSIESPRAPIINNIVENKDSIHDNVTNPDISSVTKYVEGIGSNVEGLENIIEDIKDTDIEYVVKDGDIEKRDFLDYNELYSDDDKIVYDSDEGHKIVVYKNGEKVIGLEYYFDLENEDNAIDVMNELTNDYDSLNYIDQNGQYLRLSFKEELYNDLTIADIKDVYKEYTELIKREV